MTVQSLEKERTDIYVNTHLGHGADAEETKHWIRVEAATRGYASMSEFIRALIEIERQRTSESG